MYKLGQDNNSEGGEMHLTSDVIGIGFDIRALGGLRLSTYISITQARQNTEYLQVSGGKTFVYFNLNMRVR